MPQLLVFEGALVQACSAGRAFQRAPGGQALHGHRYWPAVSGSLLVKLTMRIRISFLEKSRANSFVKANPILAGLSSSAQVTLPGRAPIPRTSLEPSYVPMTARLACSSLLAA